MKLHSIALTISLVLALASALPSASQAEAKKGPEKQDKKSTETSPVKLHVKVSFGTESVPKESQLQLVGSEAPCGREYDQKGFIDPEGRVDFSDVPVCKVLLRIFINGQDMQRLELDITSHKNSTADNPVHIDVDASGARLVN